jgi:hypothetical protein
MYWYWIVYCYPMIIILILDCLLLSQDNHIDTGLFTVIPWIQYQYDYHVITVNNPVSIWLSWDNSRGGVTRWCHVQKFACCATGSWHQYIVIWWEWHYWIFSVLLSRLQHSWLINRMFLTVNYWASSAVISW